MKNDFDFIEDKINHSEVKAPDHMDGRYVINRIADVQPKAQPASAEPAQPAVTELKPKRRFGKLTAITAAAVSVAVLTTAVTVHFARKSDDADAVVVQPAEVAAQPEGLIRFNSYDEVHAAIAKIDERNNRMNARNGYVEEDTATDYALAPNVDEKISYTAPGEPTDDAFGGSKGMLAGEGNDHSETYKQVDGVDEADCIKTDGRYIYVVENDYSFYYRNNAQDSSCVCIFEAKPGVTDPMLKVVPGMSYAKAAEPATSDEATPDETAVDAVKTDEDERINSGEHCVVSDIYIKDDRLIILCTCYTVSDAGYYYSYGRETTRVFVYDVADIDDVRLLDCYTQSGTYTSSRMIGDNLYLVTNEYEVRDIPFCGRGVAPEEMDAMCIYSIEEPSQDSFLIVSAYNTLDYTEATDSKAILGLGSDVYCSADNLYIAAADYSGYYYRWAVDYEVYDDVAYEESDDVDYNESEDVDYIAYDEGDGSVITYGEDDSYVADDNDADEYDEDDDDFFVPKTKIFKVSLADGVNFTAYGEVEGTTNNQYSFDEYNGYLRVATTGYNSDYEDVNHLYVLDGNLDLVGSVTGFAETESIKAVRYVGDTAYVITYEQTDPLFVIDLSSPAAPTILGEVKISGFSTMLVPIDENTILGLGVNTGEYDYSSMEVQDGFKLALFDVSDKTNPRVLDSKSYVNFSSEVMYNPRALVRNISRGDFLVPMDYYYYDSSSYDDIDYYDDVDWDSYYDSHAEEYGAVLSFRVEGGRIVENYLRRTDHISIDRCIYVGDTVYLTYLGNSGDVHIDSFAY